MSIHWRKRLFVLGSAVLAASMVMADDSGVASNSSAAFSLDSTAATSASGDLSEMSLEDLMKVDVRSAVGLTASDARRVPVDLTELDARDIRQSGARDLNHLLEDYVPNAQVIDHHTPGMDFGIRGIISDREDKFLYQVNGLTMNNRLLYGANDERALPLLGDFNKIDVVRGPASATHGSGALSGVIDAETYNGMNFQGADLTLRQGVVDQYTATEIRWGQKFNDHSGLFMYYGIASVQGADAPYYIGKSFPAANGLPANVAGKDYDGPKSNLGEAAYDDPQMKAHISYVNGPLEIWARYVKDGTDTQPRRDVYTKVKPADLTLNEWTDGRPIENQQFTTAARLKADLSPQLKMELLQSFDTWIAKDQREGITVGVPVRNSYENQLFSRAIATWTPNESQTVAVGTEYEHSWFFDPARADALDRSPVVTSRDWETDTISFFGEDQWKISKDWTLFLSARTDKNTYSDWLFSPRGALVFTPTKKDTFKAMAGESVRRADDEDLFGQFERTHTLAKPEKLQSYELAYERQLTDTLALDVNGFYEDYDAIGWNPSAQEASSLGEFQIAGAEFALTYRTSSTRITLSEGYSTLVHGSVPADAPAAGQGISSSPYGFGNELAAWAPSVTKLTLIHDVTSKLTVSSSVVYYSGFPGAKDYADYAATLTSPPSAVPLSDPGNNKPYGPNLFVNMGLEYKVNPHLTVRVDGYNLAALFDEKISKRNYILR
ncbi:MAG TPA: TonB-dependent receptor, partial [Tepidisphaeraceae bacterium]|nr:TonB-dependent receptor [Tepidisphaeraceae bacterium]